MINGTRIVERTTGYLGTVRCVYTNTLGNVMLRVEFDAVGAILQSWTEWISVTEVATV